VTLFDDYAAYHRDPRNRLCHEIGIPLIVLSAEAMLRHVAVGPTNLAQLATLLVMCYYIRIAGRAALPALVGLVVLELAALFVPLPVAVGLFVIGWILQFVGHAYEGRKPAFLTNLTHLLIGPLWIAHVAVQRRPS
jgi:uncharacterized membrane protein YGL010W